VNKDPRVIITTISYSYYVLASSRNTIAETIAERGAMSQARSVALRAVSVNTTLSIRNLW